VDGEQLKINNILTCCTKKRLTEKMNQKSRVFWIGAIATFEFWRNTITVHLF
jgi:hypothetical protein